MRRNLSIDVLKIVLSLFVVLLHMNFLKETHPLASNLLVNGIFRIAVPVFLIITGFYFFYVNNISKLKKWLFRTLILYVIWMAVYVSYWKDSNQIILTLFFGYHHLWYLIGTFYSGVVLYVFRNKSNVFLFSIATFLFGIGYCIQILNHLGCYKNFFEIVNNEYLFYRNFLFVCFPFLTLGFLINRLNVTLKNFKYAHLLFAGSLILVVVESYFNYLKINNESTDILISLLLTCPILFLYTQRIEIKVSSKILATLSTSIYVLHPFIMKSDFYRELESSYKIMLFFLILIPASFLLVLINKKLKYLL